MENSTIIVEEKKRGRGRPAGSLNKPKEGCPDNRMVKVPLAIINQFLKADTEIFISKQQADALILLGAEFNMESVQTSSEITKKVEEVVKEDEENVIIPIQRINFKDQN